MADASAAPAARAPELLVVDDEDAVRQLIVRGLEEEGYRVHPARHGVEALTLLATHPRIELVVSDIFMPEMDGYELGRRVAERWPGLPMLYVSAYLEPDELPLDVDGRPRRFLRKPFASGDLLTAVQEALGTADRSSGA